MTPCLRHLVGLSMATSRWPVRKTASKQGVELVPASVDLSLGVHSREVDTYRGKSCVYGVGTKCWGVLQVIAVVRLSPGTAVHQSSRHA